MDRREAGQLLEKFLQQLKIRSFPELQELGGIKGMKFPTLIILCIMVVSCLVLGPLNAREIGWAKTDQSHSFQSDMKIINLVLLKGNGGGGSSGSSGAQPAEPGVPETKKHRAPPALDPPPRTKSEDRTPRKTHRAPPAPDPPKTHRAPPAP